MASSKCCNYNAGMLRHTVVIQKRELTPKDEGGGSAIDWGTFEAGVRAYLKPLSGREQLHAQQLKAPVTHEIVMRYRDSVTADLRILFGTRMFNLRAVINVEERNRWLVLRAEEGVAQ